GCGCSCGYGALAVIWQGNLGQIFQRNFQGRLVVSVCHWLLFPRPFAVFVETAVDAAGFGTRFRPWKVQRELKAASAEASSAKPEAPARIAASIPAKRAPEA